MAIILPRRSFIAGIAAMFAAPAIVRAESLMPVRKVVFDAPEYAVGRIVACSGSSLIVRAENYTPLIPSTWALTIDASKQKLFPIGGLIVIQPQSLDLAGLISAPSE